MTRFLLIRHGSCEFLDRALAGWSDVGLDEKGREQVRRLSARIARLRVGSVVTSPLERALQTARPIAQALGLEVRVSDDLGEVRFGEWTGRTFEDLAPVPGWKAFQLFRSGTRVPGGEIMVEVQSRVVRLIDNLRAEDPAGIYALVSHGDVLRSAICHYAGMPLDLMTRIEIGPASVSVIDLFEDGAVLRYMNDTGRFWP